MIEIKKVITKSDRKKFVDFPTKLYKNEKNYVHFLRSDELNLLSEKNPNLPDLEFEAFLAYKNREVVGRILVMEHFLSNNKMNQKYARFTRFDSINDIEVARSLFNTAEKWAKERGLEYIQGPLGFNDLDKEGLLVEGFEYQNTFEGVYNFPYYDELVTKCGYEKEVDWLEFRIYPAKKIDERVERVANLIEKRYGFSVLKIKSKRKFLKKYHEQIFECIDDSYSSLLGTVPLNDRVKESTLKMFKLFLNLKYFVTVIDKDKNVIGFGIALPSLSDAVSKSKGRLTPLGIYRILKATIKPKVLDFALIGVKQEHHNKGVNSLIMRDLMQLMIDNNFEYFETNHSLETNSKVLQQWEMFNHIQHKRDRLYIKKL
jgi:GNAT superfamily N-acetyltransferase